MPTKLKKPVTLKVNHIENAVLILLNRSLRPDVTDPRHIRMRDRKSQADVDACYQAIEDALREEGIDWQTWEPPKRIQVGDYEVSETYSDGSVQVGCTRVDRATIEAIYKASTEAMGKKEEEWPKWFQGHDGDLYRFDGPSQLGERWSFGAKKWMEKKCWEMEDMTRGRNVQIPSTQAEKILKKK